MIIVLLIGIGFLLPVLEDKIKKHSGIWYLSSIVLSILSLVCLIWLRGMPGYKLVMEIFGRGALSTALFILVMLAPVLPAGKKLTKAVYRVRGELAIMAAFLILPHNIYFGRVYFVRLVSYPGSLTGLTLLAALCSVVMIALMIPLTVTSFKKVRRKMKAKNWKKLQRFSYLFYGLLYVHVMLVLYPNLEGSWPYVAKALFYTILFGVYGTLRVKKYLAAKKYSGLIQRSWRNGGAAVVAALCIFLIAIGQPGESREVMAETEESSGNTAFWQDGTWKGEGKGYLGTVCVEVTVTRGEIESVKVTSYEDDPEYFAGASAVLTKKIVANQGTEVDTVSGATYSSKGILEAVKNALSQAEPD